MTRFVILAAPRTGSNLLCTLLDSHPEILCHHELFNPQGVFKALAHRETIDERQLMEERDRDPLVFLERVWRAAPHVACIGFKWTRGQNEDVLQSVLGDSGIKKIVLRRRNRIKTYVSERIAQQTEQWEVYHEQELVMPRPRITIDESDMLEHIALNNRFYDRLQSSLRRTDQPFIDVIYENLLSSAEQRRWLEFLGVDDCQFSLRPASVKQNPTDLRECVSNFSELAAGLRSELADELHEVGI